jgi:hypothetical protein
MRRSVSEPRALACAAIALGWLACTPIEAPVVPPPPPPSATPPPPAPAPRRGRPGRTALTQPHEIFPDFVLQPIAGGRSVLAVSQHADERAAWVRRLVDGAPGPLLRFTDGHVFGAFERPDGSTTYVTSDGTSLCFGPSPRPQERTCVQSSPAAIVPVGERLALLELTAAHPPAPAGARPAHPAPKPRESKPAAHKGKAPATAKKKPSHGAPARRPSHPLVELFVRWVAPGGAIDAEPTTTGLHFEAPLDGMTLADARARPPGIDVLWFETAPGRKTRSLLGSGRLMAASLRADGTLDFASRVAVVDADLEYGWLKDHRSPRLAGDDTASVYLGLDAKGECEALRVRPTLGRLATVPRSVCTLAVDRSGSTLDPTEIAALERLAAAEPRRALGQPKGDLGAVAWAGERGYYLHDGALRSALRGDGTPRDEPPPFVARRGDLAWGAFAPDGEGVAVADQILHTATAGEVERATMPAGGASALGAPELPADRRRAARIGATWWTARGPRARLWPDASAPPSAPSSPDSSVLVGGADRGLSLDVTGGVLQVGTVEATGVARGLSSVAPSPVGAGFDACERAGGGAIVAGARPGHPGALVAFTLDAAGRAGPPSALPDVTGGRVGVRLVPLPSGGAILTDLDRRRVAWLDDDARLLASAPWPSGESDAACPYGRPMPLSFPAPTPGAFVPVPDVAEGACVVGDPVWTRGGALRWFGGTSEGLDFTPELASLPLLPATPVPAPAAVLAAAPGPASTPSPRVCPPDMVSVAGRFCVDRFEAMIVDAGTGAPLSPDYPTTPNLLSFALGEWATGRERAGNVHARAFPLPWISPARLTGKPEPVAVSRLGVRPNGYLTGVVAEAACATAGKRLCSLDEFVTACRGQDDTAFPYGDTYEDGTCNVFRDEHPAALLHGNASVGHLDPRLDRVLSHGRPLLRLTGETPACRSRWGDDAVFDMVGNLDEWVAEGNGAFAGGFYSRSTRAGCDAVVTAHPRAYLDYSTGVRCCRDRM